MHDRMILNQAAEALKVVFAEAKATSQVDPRELGVVSAMILALEMLGQQDDDSEFTEETSLLVDRILNIFGVDIWIGEIRRLAERYENASEKVQDVVVPRPPQRLQNTEFYRSFFQSIKQ